MPSGVSPRSFSLTRAQINDVQYLRTPRADNFAAPAPRSDVTEFWKWPILTKCPVYVHGGPWGPRLKKSYTRDKRKQRAVTFAVLCVSFEEERHGTAVLLNPGSALGLKSRLAHRNRNNMFTWHFSLQGKAVGPAQHWPLVVKFQKWGIVRFKHLFATAHIAYRKKKHLSAYENKKKSFSFQILCPAIKLRQNTAS